MTDETREAIEEVIRVYKQKLINAEHKMAYWDDQISHYEGLIKDLKEKLR